MGVNEKTPLRGAEEHVPYVFMTDPNRAYKKRVRQLQCLICTAILGIFGLALLVSLAYSVDVEEEALDPMNASLQAGPIRSENLLKSGFPSSQSENSDTPPPVEPKPVYEQSDNEQLHSRASLKKLSMCNEEDNLDYYCTISKYREVNGICNNLDHPFSWGVSIRPMARLLQPDYCDGVSSPRCSSSKGSLPSPHTISSKLTTLEESEEKNQNVMSSLWGQFINQDLVAYSEYYVEEPDESCCSVMGAEDSDCYSIHISETDPLFNIYNRTCLGYRRSPSLHCNPSGQREQLNKATSFLDGSSIYGSTSKIERKIRKFVNGELVLYITENNNFLPVNVDIPSTCTSGNELTLKDCINNQAHRCFNENLHLPSINHIFAKHHNFIAAQLKSLNPDWSDETLFQEARRIVVAQIQHITYNEFLGNIVDDSVVKSFGQRNSQTGYYEGYDSNVDPTVSNAFANAAFAMVFNFLPESKFIPSQNKTRPCNHYFVSRLIQRGRDHGLPSYLKWREYCGLKTLYAMDELVDVMNIDAVNVLKELYENIEDIDLFAGVFAERPSEGSSVGPVGLCIIKDQFKRLKTGDRFWYETPEQPQGFSTEQLAEIRKSALSRIICDHFEETKTVQYNIMKTSLSNPTLLCSAIPSLNLSFWDASRNIIPETNKMKSDYPSNSISSLHNVQSISKLNEDISRFVQSANSFIIKTSSKTTNITKKATNFVVNIANITASIDGNIIYQEYNKKLPITLPLDAVADTSAYTPAATVTFSGNYEDDILEGTVTLPIKDTDNFQRGKHMLEINFVSGVTIKWAGTFDLDPKKKYICKAMFQSYSKLSSPSQSIKKEIDGNDESLQCNILLVGTYYHRPFYCAVTPWWCSEGSIFYWSGETKLIFTKPAIPNALNKKGTPLIGLVKSSLDKTDDSVIKTFASVTVLKGKISGNLNGGSWMDIFNGSPPAIINLKSIVNPMFTDISTQVTWQATPTEDRLITGSFSLPYYSAVGMNVEKSLFNGTFSLDIMYKYGGSIGIIDPTKTYTCKVLFHGHKNSSTDYEAPTLPTIKGKTPFGESCTISVIGSFNQANTFLWSGDLVLAIKYKYNSAEAINAGDISGELPSTNTMKQFVLNVPNSVPINQVSQQNKINLVGKTAGVVVEKTFASVTVLKGKISGHFNGEDWMDIFNGSPPALVNLNNIVNPSYTDFSTHITWQATPMEDRLITGSFSLPYYSTDGLNIGKTVFTGNFSLDIMYKYGGSIGIIDPTKTYTCKVFFQGNKKSSGDEVLPTIKGKTPFGESCSISVSGSFTQAKTFHWLGDLELAMKYKYNSSAAVPAMNGDDSGSKLLSHNVMEQFVVDAPNTMSRKQLSQKNKINLVGKTENVVVEKTFASVTVLKGKISGKFNGEEAFEVLNGNPPVAIYLDNIIDPNAYDVSLVATWKASTEEDRLITGSFSVPYYPSLGDNTDRRKFTANFSVDVIYKYGGSIEIIDPSKTYTCKVMIQESRKSTWNEKPVSIKNKTPFGESCSITISGTFSKPSVFCYLTPWWCSKEKIFYWSGDVELALKNKYNASESDINENSLKKMSSSLKSFTVNDDTNVMYPELDNYCCGHKFGGRVISGWVSANTPGLFSRAQTIWSGELPFEIRMPVFWTPTIDEGAEISTVYGHSILWSASIFHSTIQGTYSFPQYHTGGALTWITGKYSFQLEPNPYISLYDLIVPGIKYNSNLRFHTLNSPDSFPFANPTKKDPSGEDITYGIRAPIILLGKYTSDQNVFIWNGTFIVDFSKTSKDLTYG